MFSADTGKCLISCDFSQQEPRILAFVSQDPNMIHAYETGKDIYAWIGSIIFRTSYEDCLEEFPDGSINESGKKRRNTTKNGCIRFNVWIRCKQHG